MELLQREMRAAARIITGRPLPTPAHAMMAEAGLAPLASPREALAARPLAKALPANDHLRVVAEASSSSRLKSAVGWRTVGRSVWAAAGISGPIEPTLTHRAPPLHSVEAGGVTFDLSDGPLSIGAASGTRKRAAEQHLAALPQCTA